MLAGRAQVGAPGRPQWESLPGSQAAIQLDRAVAGGPGRNIRIRLLPCVDQSTNMGRSLADGIAVSQSASPQLAGWAMHLGTAQ